MTAPKTKTLCIVGVVALLLALGAICVFSFFRMPDSTMEPTLKKGDVVIALRWISDRALKVGDLVVVEVAVGDAKQRTVRKIAALPSSDWETAHLVTSSGSRGAIGRSIAREIVALDAPPREFSLVAADGKDGKLLNAKAIGGKVIRIVRKEH